MTAIHGGQQPPATLAVRPGAIPAALRDLSQWVAWRWEYRDGTDTKPGKWTKVPLCVGTGGYARSNDPATWATFAATLAYATAHTGTVAGIGFMFSEHDGFAGIDLDGCRDRDTGAVDPWASAVISNMHSYAEMSPSGTGVKIILRAALAGGGTRRPRPDGIPGGAVEMYDRLRFFTLTGHHLVTTPAAICDAQPAVDALYARLRPDTGKGAGLLPVAPSVPHAPVTLADTALLDKARTATNGARFAALWEGHDDGDTSAGDLALCGLLAFWTGGDPARMDALFRQSARIRPKWDARHRHDGATYGRMTIEYALAGRTDYYTPPNRGVRTSARAGGRYSMRTGVR